MIPALHSAGVGMGGKLLWQQPCYKNADLLPTFYANSRLARLCAVRLYSVTQTQGVALFILSDILL